MTYGTIRIPLTAISLWYHIPYGCHRVSYLLASYLSFFLVRAVPIQIPNRKQNQNSLSGMFCRISFIPSHFNRRRRRNRNRNMFVPVTFEFLTICDVCDQNVTKSVWLKKLKEIKSVWPRSHIQNCHILWPSQMSHIECDTPGPLNRNDPGTVMIPQYWFNKTKQNTHWYKPGFYFCLESGSFYISFLHTQTNTSTLTHPFRVCCFVFIKQILGNRYGPGVIP